MGLSFLGPKDLDFLDKLKDYTSVTRIYYGGDLEVAFARKLAKLTSISFVRMWNKDLGDHAVEFIKELGKSESIKILVFEAEPTTDILKALAGCKNIDLLIHDYCPYEGFISALIAEGDLDHITRAVESVATIDGFNLLYNSDITKLHKFISTNYHSTPIDSDDASKIAKLISFMRASNPTLMNHLDATASEASESEGGGEGAAASAPADLLNDMPALEELALAGDTEQVPDA